MNLGEQLDGAPGFAVFAAFTPGELKRVRELIRGHYLRRIAQVAPQHEAAFRELEMDRYHERESLVDHAVLWSNEARHLKEEAEEEIRGMSLFQPLRRAWPAMRLNRHGMYWRIVRPGNVADVGPLHADEWFWLLDGGYDAAASLVRLLLGDAISTTGLGDDPDEGPSGPIDAKTALQERLAVLRLDPPEYVISRDGPDHAPTFRAEVVVAGEILAAGTGGSKKAASQAAAEQALQHRTLVG